MDLSLPKLLVQRVRWSRRFAPLVVVAVLEGVAALMVVEVVAAALMVAAEAVRLPTLITKF